MDPVAALAVVNDEGQGLDTRMNAAIDLLEWIAKGGFVGEYVEGLRPEADAIEACVSVLHQGLDRVQGVQ